MVPSSSPVKQDKMLSVNKFVTPDQMVIGAETMETSDNTATKEKLVISSKMETYEPVKFCVMSAMCHNNRGIAKDLKLPWPPLR